MATDTTPKTDAEHAGVHETDEHHPQPADYVKIAIVLAILTALEIAASYIDVGPLFLPLLLGLMAIKFFLVAAFFMHLRYDTRLYTRFIATGLILAVSLYAVVLVIHYSQPVLDS